MPISSPKNGYKASQSLAWVCWRALARRASFAAEQAPRWRPATRPHAAAGFCYPSCGKCGDGCWWTTCLDSVGQVAALLDEVMGDWCAHRCPLPAAAAAATAAAAAAAAAVYASGLACNPMSWSHPGASRAAPSTPLVSPTGADSSSSSPEISAPPAGSRPTSRQTVRPCPMPAPTRRYA